MIPFFSRRALPVLSASLLLLVACASEPDSARKVRSEGLSDPSAEVEPGAIVVDFKDGTTKAEFDALEKDWGVDLEFNSIEGAEDGITIARGVGDVDAVLAKIRQNPNVEAAEPLEVYRSSYVPNDPGYTKQWNLQMIDMPKAWDKSRGKGVVVAVLDTGIAYEDYDDFKQVPDLKGIKFVKGYDFVNKDEHANDDHGHGTHVAGTIAQATNNSEGVAGVAFEATLMPVKVLDHFGRGTSANIADAIRFAADNGAKVINMSLGGGGYSAVMESAVAYARKKGVTVVCAAGNGGRAKVEYPAAYEGAVAVSAVGPDGTLAPYSSYGKELDIAAPGGDKRQGEAGGIIQNTIDQRDVSKSVYASYQGTSMATPHVAAVAALLYAAGAKTPDEVEKALYDGAKPVGDKAWSEQYGHGVLNAQRSLEALGKTRGALDWNPLLAGLGMLAMVLLSLSKRIRPGYLNVLFNPGFLFSLIVSTVGFFIAHYFAGWFSGGAADVLDATSLPIPDLDRIIFGRGKLANPLFYSALIPVVASLLAVRFKGLRPVVGGLAIGFAGFLGYGAWAHAPALAWMPFKFLAMPWLVLNTLICLFVARALLRKESV